MGYMTEKKTGQLNLRVPPSFESWAKTRVKFKGQNVSIVGATAIYHFMGMTETEREAAIKRYFDFVDNGCPVDQNGLSPWEQAIDVVNEAEHIVAESRQKGRQTSAGPDATTGRSKR